MLTRIPQKPAICILIFLVSNVLSPVSTVHPDTPEIALYTEYFNGDDVLEFRCYDCNCDQTNDLVEIYDEETKTVLQNTKSCLQNTKSYLHRYENFYSDRSYVQVYINVTNDAKLFGKLRCRVRKNGDQNIIISKNFIQLPFLFCNPNSDACLQDGNCDSDQNDLSFCLINKTGIHTCVKKSYDPKLCDAENLIVEDADADAITSEDIKVENDRYCPVDEVGFCRSFAKDPQKIWYRVRSTAEKKTNKSSECKTIPEAPISYQDKPLLFNEPFLMDLNDQNIKFSCPEKTPFFGLRLKLHVTKSYLQTISGEIRRRIFQHSVNYECTNETKFDLKDAVLETNNGVFVYSLEMDVRKWTYDVTDHFTFYNKIIIFGTRIHIMKIGNKLECNFTTPIGNEFSVTTWWEKNSTNGAFNNSTFRGDPTSNLAWNIKMPTVAEYRCHAKIVYKTCSPHRKFEKTFESDWFVYTSGSSLLSLNFVVFMACMIYLVANRICQ